MIGKPPRKTKTTEVSALHFHECSLESSRAHLRRAGQLFPIAAGYRSCIGMSVHTICCNRRPGIRHNPIALEMLFS